MKAIFLLLVLAVPVLAQERRGRPSPTEEAPATPSREQTPERSRTNETTRTQSQGSGGSTPIAEKVDETPVVTHHEITLHGKTLEYTATVAQMPILDASDETEAHMFYVAYTLDEATNTPGRRPLAFAFNGGPGSPTIWLHMLAIGPRRAKLLDDGNMPRPPFTLVDNDDTLLEQCDLVFIDAVGTGYSRAKTVENARRFNGVNGDLQAFGEFIRMYLTRNNRWLSPLFIIGESYGTFRAAGLAGNLIDQGIAFNGIVLVSTVLNFETLRPGLNNSLGYALNLPTYAADAWYHKKLPADLQAKELPVVLKEVEGWAMTGYLEALNQGDQITAEERNEIVAKLARYNGLDAHYVEESNLRYGVGQFTRQLLRAEKLTIGRYDGRLTGPSPMNAGETSEFDPSGSLPQPPVEAAFMNYIRTELNYKTDMKYYMSGGIVPWDWGASNGFADTGNQLRNAFTKNPHLQVMVCASYYDLATPYFEAKYALNHLGVQPEIQKRIHWAFYEAGHMMYIKRPTHDKFKQDLTDFITQAMSAQ